MFICRMNFYFTQTHEYGMIRLSLSYQYFINLGSHFMKNDQLHGCTYTVTYVHMETQICTHNNTWEPTCTKHTFSCRLCFEDVWFRQHLSRQWTTFIFSGTSSLLPINTNYVFLALHHVVKILLAVNAICLEKQCILFFLFHLTHLLFVLCVLPSIHPSQIPGVIFKPSPSLFHTEHHFLSPVRVFSLKCFSSLLLAPFLYSYQLNSMPHFFLIQSVPSIL